MVRTLRWSVEDFASFRQSVTLDILKPDVDTTASISLVVEGDGRPVYHLAVVDALSRPQSPDKSTAALLIPQGREHEYTFGHPKGRKFLVKDTGFARLIFVSTVRGQSYPSFDIVKEEVGRRVLDLQPAGYQMQKLPILSVASNIGERKVLFDDEKEGFLVEDVQMEEQIEKGKIYWERRLIFHSNLNLIQSEMRVVSKQEENDEKELLYGFLPCGYQKGIVAALSFLDEGDEIKATLIGLGGGVLATFLTRYVENVKLDIVELDSKVASAAKKFFGFEESESTKLHIGDGFEYVLSSASHENHKQDVLIVDVNSNDSSQALSCPPECFVSEEFLTASKDLLAEGGLFVLNLCTRSSEVRDSIQNRLESVFGKLIYEVKIPNDVNRIFIAVVSFNPKSFPLNDKELLAANLPVINKAGIDPELLSELELLLKTMNMLELLTKAEKEKLRKKAQKKKGKSRKR